MFEHIGILTLTPDTTDTDRRAIGSALEGLVGEVPGLEEAVVVYDAGLREGNADLLFRMRFDSRASWEGYGAHPAHLAVVHDHIAPRVAAKTFLQIEG